MTTCSQACSNERMTGTAMAARFWVALEQRGPWGKRAFGQSHLDPQLGARLEAACKEAGGRALLIRGIDGHAEAPGPRRVYVSGGSPERPWLLTGLVDDPTHLLELPFDQLTGDAPEVAWLEPADPVVLVCTNGKRDQCCSVQGRPVVTGLYQRVPGRIWECTHISGHRFAPTGLVLPTGQALGYMTVDLALDALAAASRGEVIVDEAHDRGRGHHSAMLQAAETFLRIERGVAALDGVIVQQIGDTTVRGCVGDKVFLLEMASKPLPANPASCGIEPKVRFSWGVVRCEYAE